MKKNTFILLLSILTICFIIFVFLINSSYLTTFDNYVYNFIYSFNSSYITSFYKIITFFGSTFFILLISIIIFVLYKKNRGGQNIVILLLITIITNNILKLIIRRPRPELINIVTENTYSFPSGHSMAIMSLVGVLLIELWSRDIINKKGFKIVLSILLILLAILVMISRIYLGAHFASDILGSIIVSSIILIIYYYLRCKYTKK